MPIYFARNVSTSYDTTGMDLIWSDDFDGNSGDPPAAHWFQFDGWEDPQNRYRDAYYDAGDAYLDGNSNLRMRIRYEGGKLYLPYIQTYDWPANKSEWTTFDQGRGRYFECRAKLSGWTAGGPWWAFWLFAPENTYDGDITNGVELDIAENLATLGVRGSGYSSNPNGFSKSVNTAIHAGEPVGSDSVATDLLALGIDIRDGNFHDFGAYWDDTVVEYWCDGVKYREITTNVPTGGEHAIILSLEYDAWDGTDGSDAWDQRELIEDYAGQLPQYVDVAWVKVYENQATPTVGLPVIIDTDVSSDIDDAGALAVANKLMQLGECNILCMGHSAWHGRGVQAMSVINNYYGHSAIPIGRQNAGVNSVTEPGDTGYATYLASTFTPTQFSNSVVATNPLYRQHLAAQADNSVVFITIGPLQNIIALLDSPADGFSSLTGEQLFNQKVLRMHVMGGEYPSRNPLDEAEWNFKVSGTGIDSLFGRITVPVYFNGYEVGINTGGYGSGPILQSQPTTNPVAEAYKNFYLNPPEWVNGGVPGPILDHSTWDLIAVYTAIRGYSSYFTLVNVGFNDIASDGVNTWMGAPDSSQAYLVESMDPQTFIETYVEPLMLP